MSNLSTLTSAQLIKAAKIKDQIARLEKRLAALLNPATPGRPAAKPAKKRQMSAAGRARIVAAQKARWAKIKAAKKAK